MSSDDSDSATFSPAAGSVSGDLLDLGTPLPSTSFNLDDVREVLDNVVSTFDTTVCRAALLELPQSAAAKDLIAGIDDDEDKQVVPREHLADAAIIADHPAFRSIIAPLGRLHHTDLAVYDDVASDLERSEQELQTARAVANAAQDNFDQKNLDYVNLETSYNSLQGKHDELVADYNALKSRSANIRAPYDNLAETPGKMSSLRQTVENPPIFTGKENVSAARRCEIFKAWRFRILSQWKCDPFLYVDEDVKIIRTAMLLGPEILSGIQDDLDVIQSGGDKDTWRWKTGVEFMEYLVTRFQNVNLKMDASRRLEEFYMRNMPFSEFELELTNLMNLCGLDDSMKVHHLRNKINKRLRDALAHRDLPEANDFKKWLTVCRTVAGNLEDADHRHKMISRALGTGGPGPGSSGGSNPGGGSSSRNADETPVSQGGNKMDLDAVDLAVFIHKDVLDQRTREGKCRRCGGSGHIARGCLASVNYGPPGPQHGKGKKNKGKNRRGREEVRAADAAPTAAAADAGSEYHNEPEND